MKNKLLIFGIATALALSFAGCGTADEMKEDMQQGMENLEDGMMSNDNTDNGNEQSGNNAVGNSENASPVTRYSENNLEFDVPESWQSAFMADVSEHEAPDASLGAYSTINFYYTGTASPTKVMTIGRFPKDSWAALNEQTPEAAKKKLGESSDGKWIYSINFEENLSQDTGYTKVMEQAQNLKDKIKITD